MPPGCYRSDARPLGDSATQEPRSTSRGSLRSYLPVNQRARLSVIRLYRAELTLDHVIPVRLVALRAAMPIGAAAIAGAARVRRSF